MGQSRFEDIVMFIKDNDFSPEEIVIILSSICAEVYQDNAEHMLLKARDLIRLGEINLPINLFIS